jgi:hypothetical protein
MDQSAVDEVLSRPLDRIATPSPDKGTKSFSA